MHGPRPTSQAQHLLTSPATPTFDNNGGLTGSIRTRLPLVARIAALVTAELPLFGTQLLATLKRVREAVIFVARPLALVHTTGESLSTWVATQDICQVAGNVDSYL